METGTSSIVNHMKLVECSFFRMMPEKKCPDEGNRPSVRLLFRLRFLLVLLLLLSLNVSDAIVIKSFSKHVEVPNFL